MDERDALRARVDVLEDLCAAIYQLAGEIGAPVRILDALWAAAQGQPVPDRDTLLPVTADECTEIAHLRAALERVRDVVSEVVSTVEGSSPTPPAR